MNIEERTKRLIEAHLNGSDQIGANYEDDDNEASLRVNNQILAD